MTIMAKKNENIAEETVKKTTKKAKTEGEAVEKTEEEIKTKFIKACMKGLSVFSYTPSLIQFIYGQKNNDRPNKGSSSTGLRSLQDKYGW